MTHVLFFNFELFIALQLENRVFLTEDASEKNPDPLNPVVERLLLLYFSVFRILVSELILLDSVSFYLCSFFLHLFFFFFFSRSRQLVMSTRSFCS